MYIIHEAIAKLLKNIIFLLTGHYNLITNSLLKQLLPCLTWYRYNRVIKSFNTFVPFILENNLPDTILRNDSAVTSRNINRMFDHPRSVGCRGDAYRC